METIPQKCPIQGNIIMSNPKYRDVNTDTMAQAEKPVTDDTMAQAEKPEADDTIAQAENPEAADTMAQAEKPKPTDTIAQAENPEADTGTIPSSIMDDLTPSEVDFMPSLLRSMSTLLRLNGKNVSAQFLLAGLAGSTQITPGACLRVAEKAGLKGSILYKKTIPEILYLTLPCILLLKNNHSCVLTRMLKDTAEVIFPESSQMAQLVTISDLELLYTGYTIFGTVKSQLDDRSERIKIAKPKRWFWDVLLFYTPIYRHVAIASIVINLIGILSPLFVMNVYDRVVPNNAVETLWVLAIGIAIAYTFDFLLRTLRSYFVDVAGRNADVVLSSSLVDKILTMRLSARPESTGALVNNLREFEALREFFSSSTLMTCIDLPFLVVFLVILNFIGGPLVILPLIVMPILIGVGIYLQMASKRHTEEIYKYNMQKNALLIEMVNGIETIKSCLAESRMQRLWEAVVGVSAEATIMGRRYTNIAIGFTTFLTQLTTVAMIIWGVYLIKEGELTMGGLIGCNILLGRAMAPLMQIAGLLTRFQNSSIALKALDILMELPSENQDEKSCIDFGSLETTFTIDNVSFSYPNASKPALQNISLTIKKGEKVGIVGRMGSGKSSLVKMLIGLYEPSSGSICLGGIDIHQLASSDLRSRVGFLPQDIVLFYGTIRDNIALGDSSINDHLILRAADLSGVTDFIKDHPAGFAAPVGEQGRLFSGGQRQALALARAIVRDPDVIILDEPTSNMDNATELKIQKNLLKITKNKTLILVTHRLSMLKIIDRLIVIENGQVILDGPKQEILNSLRNPLSHKNKKS